MIKTVDINQHLYICICISLKDAQDNHGSHGTKRILVAVRMVQDFGLSTIKPHISFFTLVVYTQKHISSRRICVLLIDAAAFPTSRLSV